MIEKGIKLREDLEILFKIKEEISYESFIKIFNIYKKGSLFDVNFLKETFLFVDYEGYYGMAYTQDDKEIIEQINMLENYFEIEIVKYVVKKPVISDINDIQLYERSDVYLFDFMKINDIYLIKIPGPRLEKN